MTTQKSTIFTPNFLHFKWELASNLSTLLANPSILQLENNGEFANDVVQQLVTAYQLQSQSLI